MTCLPLWTEPARACAILDPGPREQLERGVSEPRPPAVRTASEVALISWDPSTGTEHFIRRADFKAKPEIGSFGFLVPVPSAPEIAEVAQEPFEALEEIGSEVRQYRFEPAWMLADLFEAIRFRFGPLTKGADGISFDARLAEGLESERAAPAVQVLARGEVAGMEYSVLSSRDSGALVDWLDRYGLSLRPAAREWLDTYVERDFKLVAFRFSRAPGQPQGSAAEDAATTARAVRISFRTDQPYYPYLEPKDVPVSPGRRLLVYLLSPEPVRPRFAMEDRTVGMSTYLSYPIWRWKLSQLGVPLPGGWGRVQLSALVDESASRARAPGDVIFAAAPGAEPVVPLSQQVKLPIHVDLWALLFLAAGRAYALLRRRRASAA